MFVMMIRFINSQMLISEDGKVPKNEKTLDDVGMIFRARPFPGCKQ